MNSETKQTSSKRKALILSAFVCPGVGQLSLGRKKRGYVFIGLTVLIIFALFVKTYIVVQQVMTPEQFLDLSPLSLASAFVEIRSRIYSESVPILLAFFATWGAALADIFLIGDETN